MKIVRIKFYEYFMYVLTDFLLNLVPWIHEI
jgi:hypothetical protein